ncbi:efflux RND transporter periplasmic adaptor subunit [Betaproteobacteria bacterium SCN2]|jgi:RND family efflux transporter MFP subunit|nr:efflux RND transporter periplasmic adaptor subunit [Betaproteobacteria bacterium SCN2]
MRSLLLLLLLPVLAACGKGDGQPAAPTAAASAKPALSVSLVTPQQVEWPQALQANGNIAAWQEAVIGPEIGNLRLTEVRVNVGDRVAKGQVLARIASDTVAADLAQSRAAVAEAEALLAEAIANGDRARKYQQTGFLSAQQINQYLTAEKTAHARLNAARAKLQADEVRMAQTYVRAPDAGVISARAATVGSLAQPGMELFRLIRGGRLEWRAEVSASELGKIRPGVTAVLIAPNGARVEGRVRMVAPTVDPQTLNGIVYVDLPAEAGGTLRAGSFARGEFELGRAPALALPQSAVLLREGFSYVFRLEGKDRVAQTKVTVGRRLGEQIEITTGLAADAQVVASGAGFLADGDIVRVVSAPAAPGPR